MIDRSEDLINKKIEARTKLANSLDAAIRATREIDGLENPSSTDPLLVSSRNKVEAAKNDFETYKLDNPL